MAEINEDYIKFIKCIQYKVTIATAFAIIKSKPIDSSMDDHFKKIKEKYLKECQKKDLKSPFEKKIIKYLKSDVINEILASIPNSESLAMNYSSDVVGNSEFVKMITNLKLLVNSNRSISSTQLFDKLKIEQKEKVLYYEKKPSSNLYPGFLRAIAFSSNAEYIIKKCLGSIFKNLEESIFHKTSTSFENWKGSTLENVVRSIRQSSTDQICSSFILDFVEKGLQLIWISKMIFPFEYLIIILSEFCATEDICCHVIYNLMEYFDLILKSPVKTSIYIKIPYFLKLTIRLLKKLVKMKKAKKNCKAKKRKHLDFWREKCSKIALFFNRNYPLMNKRVWNLIKILIVLEQE